MILDEPEINENYIYNYRDGSISIKRSPRNTAGWNTVEVTGHIIEKIGFILAQNIMKLIKMYLGDFIKNLDKKYIKHIFV